MKNTLKLLFGGDLLIGALVLVIIGGACANGVSMMIDARTSKLAAGQLGLEIAIDRVTNKLEILTKEADWRAATTSAPSYTAGNLLVNQPDSTASILVHLDAPIECRCKP